MRTLLDGLTDREFTTNGAVILSTVVSSTGCGLTLRSTSVDTIHICASVSDSDWARNCFAALSVAGGLGTYLTLGTEGVS